MTIEKKAEEPARLNVEAGDRAVTIISGTLGLTAVAGFTEAIFDFFEGISTPSAVAFGAAFSGSALFMHYVNQRDRGDSSAS